MNTTSWFFDPRCALFFFGVPFLFTSFLSGALWCHNRVPQHPDTRSRYHTVVRRIVYLACTYTYSMLLLPLLLLVLLLRVLLYCCCCGICCCSSSYDFILLYMYVLLRSTVAFAVSIFLFYILDDYGHAGCQGGRHPAARPPCVQYDFANVCLCSEMIIILVQARHTC